MKLASSEKNRRRGSERGKEWESIRRKIRNAGAWSLLPLRQHCLGTASLSGIINNSAIPVSRLCFMHIRAHIHACRYMYVYLHAYTYISYISIYLHFSFFLSLLPRLLSQRFSATPWTPWTRWHSCICGPVGLGASTCALGPLKEIALEMGKKNRWNLPRVSRAGRSRLHRGRLRILILYTLHYSISLFL